MAMTWTGRIATTAWLIVLGLMVPGLMVPGLMVLGIGPQAARAADPAAPIGPPPGQGDSASSLAGLFLQSCVQHVGNRQAVRAWAKSKGLQELPANAEQQFLYGLPGQVFDASDKHGRYVLISEDGGSCSVLAEQVNGAKVLDVLQNDMRQGGISFTVTLDQDDPHEKTLHQREYDASQGKARWHMLVSIVKGTDRGEAMLTANP